MFVTLHARLVSDKAIDDHCKAQCNKVDLNSDLINFMQISYDAVMGKSTFLPKQNSLQRSNQSLYSDC